MTRIQQFQKLQELLVLTPFTFHELGEGTLPPSTDFEVLEEQANHLDEKARWGEYHRYLHAFIAGLQGDDVISVRLMHPASFEALEAVYHQTLPDAVLIDAPGYHLLEAIQEEANAELSQGVKLLFHDVQQAVLSPLDLTRRVRQWSVQEGFRTVILNLSRGEVEEARIQSLVQGADELLDTEMSGEELCIRVLSHIRRHLDQYQSLITRQPNGELLERMFNRRIRQGVGITLQNEDDNAFADNSKSEADQWAMAVFHLDSLNTYGLLYGQEAKIRVLQQVATVLGQMLHVPDWIFHIEENTFIVLSTPERLDRMMPIVMKRLDASCRHFLSSEDQARDFFIWKQDSLFTRVPMLRIGAGVVSTQVTHFTHLTPVLAKGIQLALKAVSQLASPETAWLSDCLLLTGETETDDSLSTPGNRPYVIVVEPDAALAFLLEQTISMNGLEVDVMPSMMDAELAIQQRRPSAVVVDPFIQVGTKRSSTGENSPWQALQNIRRLIPYSFILATCNHDDYEAALVNGANAFLPKPYKLLPLLSWLDYVLKVKSI